MHDNFTDEMIAHGGQDDMIDILQIISTCDLSYSDARVAASFVMADVYGNTSEDVIIDLYFTRETIEKINFDGFSIDNLYRIADQVYYIHPAMR